MSWAWAQPSAWTFTIKPIAELINRYVPSDGNGWADPFCGRNTRAEFRNDMNPDIDAPYHEEAVDFCSYLPLIARKLLNGFYFDPPYSCWQVTEHYKELGKKATSMDTSSHFFSKVKEAANPNLAIGAHAITCGWNTVGFGKTRGWKKVEILVVEHGAHHYNTLVTVERKIA